MIRPWVEGWGASEPRVAAALTRVARLPDRGLARFGGKESKAVSPLRSATALHMRVVGWNLTTDHTDLTDRKGTTGENRENGVGDHKHLGKDWRVRGIAVHAKKSVK